jgi:hypothetical protein
MVDQTMSDLKLREWLSISGSLDKDTAFLTLAETKTPALRQSARAFVDNVKRMACFSRFPGEVFIAGRKFQWAFQRPHVTSIDTTGKLFVAPRMSDEEFIEMWSGRRSPDPDYAFDEETEAAYRHSPDTYRPMFEALMSTQLIMAWTAFETLAGDLWEAAVNCHPQTLATLDSKSATADAKGEGKSLPMFFLERYHYDLREKMGTILKEHRCNFQKLDGIIKAYRLAFPKMCEVSAEDFWANRDVKSLSATRNVIVHRAGPVWSLSCA